MRNEFGSDFHSCSFPVKADGERAFFDGMILYASGRQALWHLIESEQTKNNWTTLWVPSYYCEETLKYIENIAIKRYHILPNEPINVGHIIQSNALAKGDVLMLVNCFGLHRNIDTSAYDVTIVEDHTHDLVGDWATKSNADWCFASLRKTLPSCDGGALWSPRGHKSPVMPGLDSEYADVAVSRCKAMDLKGLYLSGEDIEKKEFLTLYCDTEEFFAQSKLSAPSPATLDILNSIDYRAWIDLKRKNLGLIQSLLKPKNATVLKDATFSLLLHFNSAQQRDDARKFLISNCVYPAILWPDIPKTVEFSHENEWASRMLSIHVDGRYSSSDIHYLANILNQVI